MEEKRQMYTYQQLAGKIVHLSNLCMCFNGMFEQITSYFPDDFDTRRLLAKAFAALEEHINFSKALLLEAKSRVLAQRRKSILTVWLRATNSGKAERCAGAHEAEKRRFGARLNLLTAIKSWRSGAQNSRKEREMDLLVEAKWKQLGLCRTRIG
jgi:hypothetical protein